MKYYSKNYNIITFTIVLLIAVISFVGFWAYKYANESPFKISNETAIKLLAAKKFDGVLDVRTDIERETLGYYPGSIHIPAADLDVMVLQLFPKKTESLLIYCNTGQRARRATEKLQAMGYKNTVYVVGSHTSLM
jgi:rhodanese-related sulfurtransferase